MRTTIGVLCCAVVFSLSACGPSPSSNTAGNAESAPKAASVDGKRLLGASDEAGQWMAPGRTYDEQRYSPLKQITDANVSQLGLAWYFDLNTHRGIESSPLVIDGVMYTISAW